LSPATAKALRRKEVSMISLVALALAAAAPAQAAKEPEVCAMKPFTMTLPGAAPKAEAPKAKSKSAAPKDTHAHAHNQPGHLHDEDCLVKDRAKKRS
jgi:hypothetical protein